MNAINSSDYNDNQNNIESEREFDLFKNNKHYKFKIIKTNENISIKCKQYEINFDKKKLPYLEKITKRTFQSLDKVYKFFVTIFEYRIVIINAIKNKKYINIIISNKIINFELSLKYVDYYEKYANDLTNKYNKIMVYVKELKNIYNTLKEDYMKLSSFVRSLNLNEKMIYQNQIPNINLGELNNIDIQNSKNSKKNLNNEIIDDKNRNNNNVNNLINAEEINIPFQGELADKPYIYDFLENTFTVFKSLNDYSQLIFSTKKKSIISYNLTTNTKITEIMNAHNEYISNLRHYLDKKENMDLIMSLSNEDNHLKLWKTNNWNCIVDIKGINNKGILDSASLLLNYKNKKLIFTSSNNEDENNNSDKIKVYDFNGNVIKKIKNSNYSTLFIDTYYDHKIKEIYILTGNKGYIKSYCFEENREYHKYSDGSENNNQNEKPNGHSSLIVKSYNNVVKLIESCWDGYVRIWDFHLGHMITKIKLRDKENSFIFGLCLWNNNNLLVGCENAIKLIDLKKGKILLEKKLINEEEIDSEEEEEENGFERIKNDKEDCILTIKIIIDPILGECILLQKSSGKIILFNTNT